MTRQVVLVTTSPRVAPELLTRAAWREVEAADAVLVTGPRAEAYRSVLEAEGIAQGAEQSLPADGVRIAWLVDADLAPALAERLSRGGDDVRQVPGVRELPGSHLLDVVAVMDVLRSPGGCPWDAAQTHASLMQYLVEETYEVLEAIELDDRDALVEELGDLLLQVVFHARMAEDSPERAFGIDEVADGIAAKLVRRHPDVFSGAARSERPDAAERSEIGWDAIKRAEKQRESALDGVPMAQPALALAAKVVGRVERAGLSVPLTDSAQVSAEVAGGDALMMAVSDLRRQGVDPEAALRAAVRRYADRARAAERVDKDTAAS